MSLCNLTLVPDPPLNSDAPALSRHYKPMFSDIEGGGPVKIRRGAESVPSFCFFVFLGFEGLQIRGNVYTAIYKTASTSRDTKSMVEGVSRHNAVHIRVSTPIAYRGTLYLITVSTPSCPPAQGSSSW